ncbi:hypothetical protein [Pelosinus baikalensis]|uniref:Uncharacterized protein n=1 Tax=Pelosinus baikalensis TaxID=2892015 RepID=A0ABS8HWV2_9FIRM|nr:hypothetical protein [Pelosinus baikalensis]MCC5467629.1 hypothetical protein [Pelosinus baikalensis]
MNFKDQIQDDIDTIFLDQDEFAKTFLVDDKEIVAVMIDDILQERSQRDSGNYEGVYTDKKVLSVKAADFPIRPVRGQIMRVNEGIYIVDSCGEAMGMYEITLIENES